MIAANPTPNETDRLAALESYGVLDTNAEQAFDALTNAAALICGVPISLVSLIDSQRQWFKSVVGLPGITETPRDIAFCSHAILDSGIFEVRDALKDYRFQDNPLVAGDPNIRFYAGVPLVDSDNFALGTLCVIDRKPRRLSARQRNALTELAKVAVRLLETRRENIRALFAQEAAHGQERAAHNLIQEANDKLRHTGAGLEKANELLTLAASVAQMGHWRLDRKKQVFWSDEVYRIFGLPVTPGPVDVETALNTYHPEDLAKIAALVQHALTTGQGYSCELRALRPDGTVRYVASWGQAERGVNGAIVGLFGVVQDITESKAAEHERMRLNQRLSLVTKECRIGIWEWIIEECRYIADDRMLELYGISRQLGDVVLQDWIDRHHPEDAERNVAEVWAAVHGNRRYETEFRVVHENGDIRHLRAQGTVLSDAAGKPQRMIGVTWDVTDRKAIELEKERIAARAHLAAEACGIGVWEWLIPAGKYIGDARANGLAGIDNTSGEVSLDDWVGRIHPEDRERNRVRARAAVEGKQQYDIDFRTIWPSGEIHHLHAFGKVLNDAAGNPERMIGVTWDVTDRKEMEHAQAKLTERIQLATEAGQVGIFEWNIQEDRLATDERMLQLYGITRPPDSLDNLVKADLVSPLHPEDSGRVLAAVAAAIAGEKPYDIEYRIICETGQINHLRAKATVLTDAAGKPYSMIGVTWDVSELRRLAEQLHEEKERLQITLSSIGDAVLATDELGRITFINPVAERLLGWESADAFGRPIDDVFRLVSDDTGLRVESPVGRCLADRAIVKLEDGVSLISRDGSIRAIQDSVGPVRTCSGDIIGAVLVFQDVSRAREMQRALSFSATHDALTGLVNRAKFEEECRTALELAPRSQVTHALCFIDLDRFKLVNDTAGHAAGDMMLRQVATVMRDELRSTDMIARLGGDEFGLLLRECAPKKAQEICETLISKISAIRLFWNGTVYDVGASVGIAMLKDEPVTIGELMSQADVACYASKHGGRNRVSLYDRSQSDAGHQHREIFRAAGIRNAIENDRFILYGQEIVTAAGKKSAHRHIEILLRMIGDDGSIILPAAFIPAAERFGLMTAIDRWVVREALIKFGPAVAAQPDLRIAINLSGNSLSDANFLEDILSIIARSAIDPQAIQFEITETAMMNHLANSSRLVTALRNIGCTIALDDFGCGLSSFSYMRNFAVDFIKIDGSFVRDMDTNSTDLAIVKSINALAHQLGAKTVAESVETADVFDILVGIGADFAQGYAIGRPAELSPMLRELCH